MPLDYPEERCRMCLGKAESYISLHKKVSIDEDNILISKILKYCGKIEILHDDRKPQKVCSVCIETAKVVYRFILTCMQSETTLNTEILNKMINHRNPLEFKKENDIIEISDEEISNIKDKISKNVKDEKPNLNDAEVGSEEEEESDDSFNDYDNAELEESSDCFEDCEEQKESNNTIENNDDNDLKKCMNIHKRQSLNQETHRREKPYKCDKCGNTYQHLPSLRYHQMRRRTDNQSIACNLCGKSYMWRCELRKHKMVHLQFKCDVCSKGFNWKNNLQIHMRLHTGEKPYVCMVCGKAYSQANGLRSHKAVHHPDT